MKSAKKESKTKSPQGGVSYLLARKKRSQKISIEKWGQSENRGHGQTNSFQGLLKRRQKKTGVEGWRLPWLIGWGWGGGGGEGGEEKKSPRVSKKDETQQKKDEKEMELRGCLMFGTKKTQKKKERGRMD